MEKLMSEEEIRQYFIQNGGMVRNTEIVNHFRAYLSNPAIRDEARVLFKTYVNKLASVKIENGEKFLVLKRQYFLPIDGNGNPKQPLAHHPSVNSIPGAGGYGPSTSTYNINAANIYGTPPTRLERRNSQPALYSSHSNYADPYNNNNLYANSSPNFVPASGYLPPQQHYPGQPLQNVNVPDYPPEYGLPMVPPGAVSSPKRYVSPQNSYGGGGNRGSPASRIPPPYRPPPPAGRFQASPSAMGPGISRRSSVVSNRSYYSSTQSVNALVDPSESSMFHHHRSASVTGLNHSAIPGENINLSGAPPPPVPPRSRRSVERSMSLLNNTYARQSSVEVGVLEGRMKSVQPQSVVTEQMRIDSRSIDSNSDMMDSATEKENLQINDSSIHIENDEKHHHNERSSGMDEMEQKISVKERMQKFNRIASEGELTGEPSGKMSTPRNRRDIAAKHESGDFDTASLSSLDPKSKEWMMVAMKCDYAVLNKMAQENPALVRKRDMNGVSDLHGGFLLTNLGHFNLTFLYMHHKSALLDYPWTYTALHWAAKHGNLDCVKLLAGTFKSEVNNKSNGGYTPLHLAAQFGRQDVYDVLFKTYNADVNIRDHSGKKPMQYLIRQDASASLSMDSFKKLKEKRRHTEQRERDSSSFLRIGSLNVKVKSTRDAFGYLLGKTSSSSNIDHRFRIQKTWGSADNLPEVEEKERDKHMMPPPSGVPKHKVSKRRSKHPLDPNVTKESKSDSDSDSAFGFGSDWVNPLHS